MAKETSKVPAGQGQGSYGEVVAQLEAVVKKLEGGELSLEDSLMEFETGVRLVRQGEKLLNAAERRVEELLADRGGEEQAVPMEGEREAPSAARRPGKGTPQGGRGGSPEDEKDVPF